MKFEQFSKNADFHLAIVMDGNGRWATNQNKPRFLGHQAGAERVREIVETATTMDVDVLTLFAFSSDNWYRPKSEVDFLMHLLGVYLKSEISRCLRNDIKLSIIGRRDRLKPNLVKLIKKAEEKTKDGNSMHLRIAVDYSSRDQMISAFQNMNNSNNINEDVQFIEVDFLIRTGGEKRLSDFLLWECAYAELYFTKTLWPDFNDACLTEAMDEFYKRDRRFGKINQAIAV